MKLFSSILLLSLFTATLWGQSQNRILNPWSDIPNTSIDFRAENQRAIPAAFRSLNLEEPSIQAVLAEAPLWRTDEAEEVEVRILLPIPDGSFQAFRVVYAPVMAPELARRFPEIRTYAGYGIDDPTAYVRFDLTPQGFHAYIRSGSQPDIFIDPYKSGLSNVYLSYYKKDFSKYTHWGCSVDEVRQTYESHGHNHGRFAGDCTLRTYRLALACTGEYAQFHGGTVAATMAAMNTTMARVNGIFEIDASVTMEMVPNNDQLIFLDPNTDPYTNSNGSAMLSQNQTTCDNTIGSSNYDIGHVFSTGGGGVAYLGSVCNNSIKAGGVTGQPNPVGDPFDVDYVSHEMGHQYGANHTQNNSCNRNNSTAMEPGSASTIMGYAGICSPNVQNNSDAYFHGISLQEMGNFTTGSGNNCSVNQTINDAPTANAGANYTIPASTSFVLEGSASDPNGDQLTYCWEQFDNQVASMPPQSTNTSGPAFRSLDPATSPDRYMPNLSAIVNNQSPTWEVLPSVSRTMNFRLTVRDNKPGGGCTEEDDMVVTVAGGAGPFLVTAPNTGVSWAALSQQTVTWDVANTTSSPVSCSTVDIYLSTDGGFTYPITLASGVPNDGSQTVTIPNNQTSQARVMVRGGGNIFFDISNQNFTIGAPQNGFTIDVSPNNQTVCQPNNAVFSVDVNATGSFSGNVTLSASGVPSGASASFSVNPIATSGNSQMTISGLGAVATGSYNITVTGTSGSTTQSETVTLVVSAAPGGVTLASPSNGAIDVSANPTLSWNAATNADDYDLQLATDAGFSNIVENPTGISGTSYNPNSLTANTTYFWRVRSNNSCGTSAYSTVFSFTTANISCGVFASTNVPVSISSSGTPTITSTLNINASGSIQDVNVLNLDISHTWINDLIITLTSPQGTSVTLINRICNSQNNILTNLDDEAGNSYASIPCPPTNNDTYQPFEALSGFDGEDLNGIWTLTIQDVFNQDGGSLNAWSLEICYGVTSQPLTVSTSSTDVSCNGGTDGTATATASGGNGSYSYNWSNGGTTATITGLSAGTYNVTVTSGAETATGSVTVNQAASAVAATASSTDTNCGIDDGTATVSASGGTAPYTYNWNTGATTATITGLAAGTYSATVTDANGCTATASTTVGASSAITATASATDENCVGANDGTATASGSGGTSPYTYIWSNGGTTATITGLGAGTYNATVTDANGCTATASATVGSLSGITASASSTDESCSGANNGTATASGSGGTSPYTYIWSNGGITAIISGLGAGTYNVTVTDANGCTATASTTVGSLSGITATASSTDESCNGSSDGTATASGFGGTSPYTYAWSNGGNTATISGLGAGTYDVTVTDANGCSATALTTVGIASSITASTSSTDENCSGANDGTATASGSGGTSPYTYAWSNGGTTATISGLGAGTYDVTVTDANGCVATASATVGSLSGITASTSSTDESCNGANNGTATASGFGGTSPYTYAWSNGGNTATISGLGAGTYDVTVTDANGCVATASATVGSLSGITASASNTDESCNGANDGTATASGFGGTSPYTYAWSNGGNTATISGLGAGTYDVTVTDANGCTATASTTVGIASSIAASTSSADESCIGANNGTATASGSGGTSPYTYAWSNGGTTATITGLGAGTYDVTVTDANGCTATASTTVGSASGITASASGINVSCNGGNDGSATASGSGGTSPYTYVWSNGGTTATISGLSAGTYNVTATDANGCSATASVSITQPGVLSVSASGTDPSGGNNGSATASASGGTSPYAYNWSNGGTTATITGLAEGTYTVTVTDTNGCTATASVTLTDTGGCTQQTVDFENFDSGWGIWNDGGSDCRRSARDAAYANSGSRCVRLRDNTNTSVTTTDNLNLSNYQDITVDFTYIVRSFDNSNEDFWLQISTNGGASYQTVEEWNLNDEFVNNVRYFDAVTVQGPFSSNTRIRFRCDASGNSDWVYLDDVTISGCANGSLVPTPISGQPTVETPVLENTAEPIKASDELVLFPNPTNSSLELAFESTSEGRATVYIVDLFGKVVYNRAIDKQAEGRQQIELSVEQLAAGTYFLVLVDGETRRTTRFIKI